MVQEYLVLKLLSVIDITVKKCGVENDVGFMCGYLPVKINFEVIPNHGLHGVEIALITIREKPLDISLHWSLVKISLGH